MKKSLLLVSSLFALSISSSLFAADIKAGKEKATSCAECHGTEGISPAGMFPNLAGQHAEYLESALKQYRDGDRVNDMMTGMVRDLTDETIANLAAYYASLKSN